MKSSDISLSLFIILVFVLLYVFNILAVGIKTVEQNWPTYRCNPVVMPFASVFGHDAGENFTYCIQTMQTNYMGYLMQPLNYNLDVISNLGAGITQALNDVRAFFNTLRDMVTNLVQSIFGVFLNILIEFQRLTLNIKDLFAKMMGILATLLYTLSGSIMTMESTWAGPPGQLVRALCFEPDTKLMTEDGLVEMSNLKLGTKLKNGAIVQAVMRISNLDEDGEHIERVYEVDRGEEGQPIYVSGSHLIYDPQAQGFVHVKDLRGSNPSIVTERKCDEFACLITSNHTIPIGEWLFHDWEDNNGSPAKSIV